MPDLATLRSAADHGIEGLLEATDHAPRARRNLLLGLWAGRLLGHADRALPLYALSVMEADHEEAGDADVLRRLSEDLALGGVAMDSDLLRAQLIACERAAYAAFASTD
jgi:hypothetical protein